MNDTPPDMFKIYVTLRDKIYNLTDGDYSDPTHTAISCIRNVCYQYQYTGTAQKNELIFWCEENFGNDWIWNWNFFYFKHERDLLYFLLRWR